MSAEDLYTLLEDGRLLRTSDLPIFGLHRMSLSTLLACGSIEKVSRGVYIRSDVPKSVFIEYAILSMRIPHSIFSLSSALALHKLNVSCDTFCLKLCKGKKKIPVINGHDVLFVTRSQKFFSLGVQTMDIHGVEVRYTDLAHSVAECVVFRNRLGIDRMLAYLQSYLHDPRYCQEEFEAACRAHRVHKVVTPFLQTIRLLLKK